MSDYINQITATDGTTYDIKDTISGYTTNTGTVTGMTTTAGTHTAGAQTVSSGIITTNIPTNTSHLTNDSGFITSYTDEKLKVSANTGSGTFYPVLTTTTTTAENKKYDTLFTCVRSSGTDAYIGIGINGTAKGSLRLYTTSTGKYGIITPDTLTDTRTYTLPDQTGTIALTSDLSNFITDAGVTSITTASGTHTAVTSATGAVSFNVPTKTSQLTNDSGFITTDSDEKVKTAAVTSGTQYYPVVGTDTTSAATKYYDIDYGYYASTGTTSAVGYGRLKLGNTTASGTAGNKYGWIRMCGTGTKYIDLKAQTVSANRTLTLPDVTGNVLAVDSNYLLSSAAKATASDGTAERIVNVKYGSSAPSGTATTGTVYFQTGSSAYTFQPRVNLTNSSYDTTSGITSSGVQIAHFTLSAGLYLITFQVNAGTVASGATFRVDLLAGSNTITQVRTHAGGTGLIMNGSGLVECTSNTTIYFKGTQSSGTNTSSELHYSYVKLF